MTRLKMTNTNLCLHIAHLRQECHN